MIIYIYYYKSYFACILKPLRVNSYPIFINISYIQNAYSGVKNASQTTIK